MDLGVLKTMDMGRAYFVLALALFAFSSFTSQTHAALIGHWSLDSDDIDWGTGEVRDSSGNGNHGTAYNLTAGNEAVGQVGGGVQFNGTNSYIGIPANGSFPVSGNNSRTVCMWFKPTSDSWIPNDNTVFEYGVIGDSFGVDMHVFPEIEFYTWQNDLFASMGVSGHDEDWLQVCWVWDGATNSSIVYSNGVLRGSQAFGGGISTPQTEVNIGRSALVNGYFPGIIDDVRMYDTVLTDVQIQTLYDEATAPVVTDSDTQDVVTQRSPGGRIHYGCKDTTASNYEYFARHNQELCRYENKAASVTGSLHCARYDFPRRLEYGSEGEDVLALQKFLNCAGFTVADTGPGSLGKETVYFFEKTRSALIRFQEAYSIDTLVPVGALSGTGIFAEYSKKKAATLMTP